MISESLIVISPRIDLTLLVRNYISVRVGAVRIPKYKATGQRCRPFVCAFCVFERGIKPIIVKIYKELVTW